MEKKIEVKNLRISFKTDAGKVQAVRGIDFDLYKGETLAIVGESGSGKSVTNKAIIGISANNADIESGEIIYDGQDLLQISEEDFHKLRGDKIAMIFQDPLSALDPINKIGQQMTEAMILKNRANRRNARKLFNKTMKYLVNCINESMGYEKKSPEAESVQKKAEDFDTFTSEDLRIEGSYNKALETAKDALAIVKDLLLFIEKNHVEDFSRLAKSLIAKAKLTINPYVCDSSLESMALDFETLFQNFDKDHADYTIFKDSLLEMQSLFEEAIKKVAPNFFALGYFSVFGKEELPDLPMDELNAYLRKYLDDNFMLDFINLAKNGVIYSNKKSLESKQIVIDKINECRSVFENDETLYKDSKVLAKELIQLVKATINPLKTVKESVTYTFESAFKKAMRTFYHAIPNNKKEQARFEKEQAKYDKIIAKGKTPDYKVIPAKIIDVKLAKENMLHRLDLLVDAYSKDIDEASVFDADTATVALIDFFKEQAQRVAYVVTRASAKAKALKLMEEVGIPNPRERFNQYPFEFSGGMRQRIVIAIALSADPDILICDEPTTALDVTIQSQILELINRIKKQRNLSIIFITHDLGVVANMADRIAVMYAGKIVETGTCEDIFYDPRHPYTWALLSSMPDLDTKDKLDAIPGTPPNMVYPPKGDAFAARNKYAMKIDFELEPPMFEISETHKAATWLLDKRAPKITPPEAIVNRIKRMKKKRLKGEKNE